MSDFVHLHLHSEYSLLDGACRIADIPKAAKREGHSAVAITDHGVLYGIVDFFTACKNEGIKPIIGCEMYVAPTSRFEKSGRRDVSGNHLVLLAKNEVGYKNLVYLSSKSFTEGFYGKPRIDIEILREYSDGIIALSACLAGKIPQLIISGDIKGAREYAMGLDMIFGRGNFYLELQSHGIKEQKEVNAELVRISRETGIPLVATNDVHYIKQSDSEIQAVLMCIQTNTTVNEGCPIGFETNEFYYKSTDEMSALFPDLPEAIENSAKIAEQCNFELDFSHTFLPKFPCGEKTPKELLSQYAAEGLERRIDDGRIDLSAHAKEEYEKRAEYELDIIDKMGYSDYFLVVRDYVDFAKTHDIPVGPGRGSGAGSLVAYLVGITDVDSIKFDLLFERFLNAERKSMPDIDIDFCYVRHDEVVEYVRQKYGDDHVAHIIAFGTMAARAAVRDVGRALGMSYADVDAVAKLIPRVPGITIERALEDAKLKDMYMSNTSVTRLIDFASALEGMPRHASTHAAGVVITEKPLTEYLPVATNGDTLVTQFEMGNVEKLGLVKFDFLALRYLTIISDAVELIKEKQPDFDISKIPYDDKETFDLISSGKTGGVFQLESTGMKQFLVQLKPQSIDDVIATIALYRPGPMESIPRYLDCRAGKTKPEYKHPCLEKILSKTYGCIIYQEQVMQICRELGGYTYGKADIVCRAMSKKKTSVMEAERVNFISGAKERGMSREDADNLFDEMAGFAKYAFNKSHATSYGILLYRTAYLKAHFEKEYMAALLTSVLGDFSKTSEYISECRTEKISVLPPDINQSRSYFSVYEDNIRFGLLALKGIGAQFSNAVVKERRHGDFKSLEDFINRMKDKGLNKMQLESLIKCGAFDMLGVYRSKLLAVYEKLIDAALTQNRSNLSGQIDMFSMNGDLAESVSSVEYPDIPELLLKEKLVLEKESSGLYFSGHLLDDYSKSIESSGAVKISEILSSFSDDGDGDHKENDSVKIAGMIIKRTNKATKTDAKMAFITIEDKNAEIEVLVFPKQLENLDAMLTVGNAVLVGGRISVREDEPPKILLSEAQELISNSSCEKSGAVEKKLFIKVPDINGEECKKALAILGERGNYPVIVFDTATKKYVKAVNKFSNAEKSELVALEKILGGGCVVLK